MFNVTFLPRRIRVSKIDVCFEQFCDEFMFGKFSPIVGDDGEDMFTVGKEHSTHCLSELVGVFAVWRAFNEAKISASFH